MPLCVTRAPRPVEQVGDVRIYVEPVGHEWEVVVESPSYELRSRRTQHEFESREVARQIALSLRAA